jgi:hypothetical protein
MREARWATLALALCAAGCATAPRVEVSPAIPSNDAIEVRQALEKAIAVLPIAPIEIPKVDFEAAASIPVPEHPSIRSALAYFTSELRPDIQLSLIRSAQYKKLIDRVLD